MIAGSRGTDGCVFDREVDRECSPRVDSLDMMGSVELVEEPAQNSAAIACATSEAVHAGASFPQVRIAKKRNWPTNRLESLALEHELLAFSGCAGLRLFAAFVKLDQAYPPLKSRALRTQNSLRLRVKASCAVISGITETQVTLVA